MKDQESKKGYDSLEDLVALMDPEVHANLRTAVELGRWANGDRLSPEQLESCLQAIIAYEARHLPENERVGFIDRTGLQQTHCHDETSTGEEVMPMKWVEDTPSGTRH